MDEPGKADGLTRPKYTWNLLRPFVFKAEVVECKGFQGSGNGLGDG